MVYAARRAVREPLVTGVIVLTLAIGIGSTVTVASVVQRMLLAPLPYPGAERLVVIRRETRDGSLRVTASREMLAAFRGTVPSLERVEAVSSRRLRIERAGRVAMGDVGVVSQGLLDFLHVVPAAGRSFAADELTAGENPVIMLSYARWQRDYAGKADAIGRHDHRSTIAIYTIVGVMPRLFDPSVFGLIPKSEVWLPDVPAPTRVTSSSPRSAYSAPGRSASSCSANSTRRTPASPTPSACSSCPSRFRSWSSPAPTPAPRSSSWRRRWCSSCSSPA